MHVYIHFCKHLYACTPRKYAVILCLLDLANINRCAQVNIYTHMLVHAYNAYTFTPSHTWFTNTNSLCTQENDNIHKLVGNATPKELPEIVNKVLQGHASSSRVGMGELAMRVAGFQNR
jgi:hypothetical protein